MAEHMAAWEIAAAKKRQTLQESIPREWRVPEHLLPSESEINVTLWPEHSGWFTEREIYITSMAVETLVQQLAVGALKSEAVVKAFCKRAAAAHQLVNNVLSI